MGDDFVNQLRIRLGRVVGKTRERPAVRDEPARLSACQGCGSTYIATDSEECPACGDRLEPVPNERDLGLV